MSEPTPPGGGTFDINQVMQLIQQAQANGGKLDPFNLGAEAAAAAAPPPPSPAPPAPVPTPTPEPAPEPAPPAAPLTVSQGASSSAPAATLEREQAGNDQPKTASHSEQNQQKTEAEIENPIAAQLEAQNQGALAEKMPIFRYKTASQQLTDDNITFDELRIQKSQDFLALEEAKSVSWTVTYGKVVRKVADPVNTSIHAFKQEIERSNDFKMGLKTSKDKKPDCILTPTVTVKSKGTVMPDYKGLFLSQEEALSSDKVICLFPARDGTMYQLRKTGMGEIVTPIYSIPEADAVEAGFMPAFPRVPWSIISEVVAFFRCYTLLQESPMEVLVQIFWDTQEERHVVAVPRQSVNAVAVHADMDDEGYPGSDERYVLCMDIHSHDTMKAFFSCEDDKDECDDGVYLVMGRLDHYFPEIKARVCNGGVFVDIDPDVVLEPFGMQFPVEWCDRVTPLPNYKQMKSEVDQDEFSDDLPGEDRDAGCWGDGWTRCPALVSPTLRAILDAERAASDR